MDVAYAGIFSGKDFLPTRQLHGSAGIFRYSTSMTGKNEFSINFRVDQMSNFIPEKTILTAIAATSIPSTFPMISVTTSPTTR